MTLLLQRENTKNEAHLKPLRQNAQNLSFLTEATKSNDVLPLSETTDFLTDQLRTLISLLRTLRSLPTNAKPGSAEEVRRKYLEQTIARNFGRVGMMDESAVGGEKWNEQKEAYEAIGSLEDIRKLEGR